MPRGSRLSRELYPYCLVCRYYAKSFRSLEDKTQVLTSVAIGLGNQYASLKTQGERVNLC